MKSLNTRKTPAMLNHHPHVAVHWNAATFKLVQASGCILLPYNVTLISQTVPQYHVDKQTN